MLKHTKKFQQEKEQEKKRIEEISKIVKITSDIEKEYSVEFAIKRLSLKRKKTPEEKKTLDTLLAMLKEKQNVKPSDSLASTELNQAKNQEIQVKPFPTPSDVKVIDQLQKVQVEPIPTRLGEEMFNQLKEKVDKRRVLIDKDTINTEHTQKNKKKSEEQNTVLTGKSEEGKFSKPTAVTMQFIQKKVASDQIQNSKNLSFKNIENDEFLKILAKRKEISEGIIENNEKNEEAKFSNPTAVEVQLEQKNTDNIAVHDQTQNSDEDSFLLQQLKAARDQIINKETTVQEDNLPSGVKSEFIDFAKEKKLEEKKEQDLFNFSEIVCGRSDLSKEETQEIINFHERVCNVELRLGNEADKKRFENTVSKIDEEITRLNSIFDDEFNNNLKTINEFIKENHTQQQPQNLLSLHFKPDTKHESVNVEMIPKLNFK